jgi:hypothetical protein
MIKIKIVDSQKTIPVKTLRSWFETCVQKSEN